MTALQLLAYISAALIFQLVVGVSAGIWHRRDVPDKTRQLAKNPAPLHLEYEQLLK